MYSEQNEEENQISKATLSIVWSLIKCYVFENNPNHGNIINSACNQIIIKIPFYLLSVAFEIFDFLFHFVQSFVHKFLCRACE